MFIGKEWPGPKLYQHISDSVPTHGHLAKSTYLVTNGLTSKQMSGGISYIEYSRSTSLLNVKFTNPYDVREDSFCSLYSVAFHKSLWLLRTKQDKEKVERG